MTRFLYHISIYPKEIQAIKMLLGLKLKELFYKFGPLHHQHRRETRCRFRRGGSGSGRTFDTAIPLMLGPATIPKCNACVPRTWNLSIPTHTNMDRRIPVLIEFGASERFQLKHLSCWTAPGMNDTLDLITNQCDWVLDQYFIGIQGTIVTMTTWMCSCLDNLTCPSLTWANFHTPVYK